MSLNTVLKIGKVLRSSEDNIKYFRYVLPCPSDVITDNMVYINIPVNKDFSFDWSKVGEIDQNKIDKLYYLKFKTSDNDNNPIKYIFGDIYYGITKGEEKGGWYKINIKINKKGLITNHSFFEGEKFIHEIDSSCCSSLYKFRESFENSIKVFDNILRFHMGFSLWDNQVKTRDGLSNDELLLQKAAKVIYEKICLKRQSKKELFKVIKKEINSWDDLEVEDYNRLLNTYTGNVFLHFDFEGKGQWYDYSELFYAIQNLIYKKFISKVGSGKELYVFDSYLYKNICSGSADNDIQFPSFNNLAKYKSASFTIDNVKDLFYALTYTNSGIPIYGTNIKLIVLPRGDNLKVADYEKFIEKRDESQIVVSNESYDERIFFDFAENSQKQITSFDLIFCKKGGTSSPDKDLIEISGIEKSKLQEIRKRIENIAYEVYNQRKSSFNESIKLNPFSITYSLIQILGNPQINITTGKIIFAVNPKYQSHILKVLPLIYNETYFNDDILLPAFIQNLEYSIRASDNKYKFLKYDLMFLLRIQNNKNDRYMKITKSESYQIGLMLGSLAKELRTEISSFEKNYVGNLTRRIGNLADFIKLKTDIEQKLVMHGKANFTFKTSYDLSQKVKDFEGQYDKEECAFGFMESYFKPFPSNSKETSKSENNNN